MWPRRVPDAEHPGRGDGERLRPGWVAQPICAASAGGLCAGAIALARSLRGVRGVDALAGWTLVAALAANGVGSAGFHGPGDRISRGLHDAGLWAMVPVSVAGALRLVARDPVASARSLAFPLVTIAVGGVLSRQGRTGGPWCRPRALLQPHAAWHLLASAAVTTTGRRTWGAVSSRRT